MLDPAVYTRNWWVVSVPLPWEPLTFETGASQASTFSRKTTHLLCPSGQGPKAEKAVEWGIPVVDMIWLDGLLMTTRNSSMTEDGANPIPPRSKDGEGGVVKPEPVLQCTFFSSPLFLWLNLSK